MSDSSHQASGGGRSRGRARARGSDGQVSVPSLRRPGPGDAPTAGRGRGVSVERPGHASTDQAAAHREPIAGRAYHPQQNNQVRPGHAGGTPAVGTVAGRASHRGGQTRPPGQEGISGVTEAMANVHVASPPASAHVGSGHSSVQGSSQPSVGRGTSRGGRERKVSILRTRPTAVMDSKKGKGGKDCKLLANFFALTGKTDWRLMQYRVDFKPEEDQTFIRKMLVRDHQAVLPKYMFDGTLLYTTTRLSASKVPVVLNSLRKSDQQMIEITIKEVGELQPTDYQYLSFFNMVLRQCLERLNLQLLGRNYYDPMAAKILNNYKLEMWPGYETSIRQHENQVLLCCDVTTKVLRMDTVLSQFAKCLNRDSTNFKSLAEKSLLGAIVITRYNNKTYRIDDICWDTTVDSTFEKKDGTKIDYKTYYLERYQVKITDSKQPLLISMPKLREARGGVSGPVYLVPELCFMTGLTDEQRADYKLMKDMADYTRQTPDKRVESLNKFSARINNTPEVKQLLESWNLQFSTALQKFNARILDPEEICGKSGSKTTYKLDNADWGKAITKWQMVSAATCSKWYVIYPPGRDEAVTMEFVKTLVKVSPSLGFMLANPKYEKLMDNRPASYIQGLDRVMTAFPTLQMVMVVIPNNKGEHYHAVKKKCCIERPIPSQVMTGTVLGKPKANIMSIATKVAIQMNCKLGGEPWNVAIPLKDTMVMGFDTYHDSVNKGTSVGALVSSTNSTFTKYSSSCIFHKDNTEITMGMKAAVIKALRRYKEANGNIPTRFIFFRDGVGDGQIEYVRDQEVTVIRETLQGVFKENNIETPLKFTYVIVSKRINARFFLDGRSPGNPPSGTVVDDVVTLPERYDFFLVSQSVRQGTVNPTSYNVIEDTGGLKPEHLQKLAYKLTHLYYNWPGTVRVPAPCQYAHKLAFLVGQSLHKLPDARLEDKLFYL